MVPHIPLHDLWWLAAGGAGYGARYMKARVEAARALRKRRRASDPTGELLRLQTLHGYNAHSMASIAPGALLWSTPEIDGAIIYGEFGRVWLAAGDPLARLEDTGELARCFGAFARRRGRIAAFVPATTEFARRAAALDFTAVKIGAAPYFDLKTWAPHGNPAKTMRADCNQARRAGVVVEMIRTIDDSLKRETAQLCLRWLGRRRAAATLGWLLALDPFLHAEYKRYFAARAGGKLAAFLAASPIPARRGWYLEDVLRDPGAPPGAASLLVVEALKMLAREKADLATLGTAPLATFGENDVPMGEHPVVDRTLRMASRRLGAVYNFEGLCRFKAKFVPSWWESEYALSQRGVTIPPRVGQAILRAIVPGGLTLLLTRQVVRVIRSQKSD